MADDLEALEVHLLVWSDARFLLGDGNLVEDGVDAFQIGKQKAPAMSVGHDDAVALRVELLQVVDGLRSPSTSTEYSR